MERKHQSKNHYAGRTLCCHNPNWRSREGTLSPTGAPGSCSLYKFSVSPRQWRTPAHSPHPCTYQQTLAALIGHSWRLEHGAGCPGQGPLPAHSVTLAAVPAPVSFNPPSQQAGQRGEDTKREVTGGVDTSPPQVSPSLQKLGGCARQVAPLYLPTG